MFALCLSHLQKCNYNILNVSEHDYIAYNCSSNIAKKMRSTVALSFIMTFMEIH